jgi:hypothetical protein
MNARRRSEPEPDRLATFETASKILAPATVLTALLVYIGWSRTNAYFGYFGVNSAVLSLSVQDYMLQSAGSSFVAVTRFLAFALVLVGLDLLFRGLIARSNGPLASIRVRQGLAILGSLVTTLGIIVAITESVNLNEAPLGRNY